MQKTFAPAEPDTRTLMVLALAATAGVLVEFYDFFIYGFAAASAFPQVFFPHLPPVQALVFSYLAFGAGFPARLAGAFLFGHFGDRIGRKTCFLVNLLIVGGTTCLTGLLPGYAVLGLAAPVLLVLLRIIQGIGLGGEFGGATALLSEFGSNRPARAFWTSLANLGIPLGGMAATAALWLTNRTFATTGWRLAMLLSAIIVLPAVLARLRFADSRLFERLQQRKDVARTPSLAVFKAHTAPILLLALVSAFQQMDGYVSGTYLISFMNFAGIPLATAAGALVLSRMGDVLGVILSGPLADLLKRRTVAHAAIAITMVLSYPLVLAILGRHIGLMMALQFLITFFGIGLLHGLAPVLTSESFPTRFRYSGAGISYNLSAILGGMIAPSFLAGRIGYDVLHRWRYIPLVYAGYGATAMAALLFIRETSGVHLDDLDADEAQASSHVGAGQAARHGTAPPIHDQTPGGQDPEY